MKRKIKKIIFTLYKMMLLILMFASILILTSDYNIINTKEYSNMFFITKTISLIIAFISYKLFIKKIIIK